MKTEATASTMTIARNDRFLDFKALSLLRMAHAGPNLDYTDPISTIGGHSKDPKVPVSFRLALIYEQPHNLQL